MKDYTSFGLISDTRKVFDQIQDKNIVSWTILISGFTKRGHFYEAVNCFSEMLLSGVKPNEVTISSILPAFANTGLTVMGKAVHGLWVRRMYESNVIVETCLVDMYSRFGCMNVARLMFAEMPVRNVVSWNVIISGYANNEMGVEALRLFNLMRGDVGCVDCFTFMSVISAVSSGCCGGVSSAIHGLIVKSGDVVAWTQLLEGFSSCQQWSKVIEHSRKMMSVLGMALDSTALVSIISSCSRSGALLHGRRVHALIVKRGFSNDVFVGSALIDLYTNCGDLDCGKKCFNAMDKKDVVCWNAMIKAMGANGNGKDAVDLLWKMEDLGFKPNDSTLISVLSACSHAGMIEEGVQIFCHMINRWGVVPNSQHYACLVDLLGRSGRLDEAHSVMDKMPMQPHIGAYGALLNACKMYGNTEMGADIFRQLLKLDLKDAGHFCSVLNMYASAGDWEGVESSNVALRLNKIKKDPGYSSSELNMQVPVS
ncbi:putative pentatricopeptide repeat-containing protein At3g49142 [Silene latifolia]|uniref:putative pentatricopeptide repeat-containing protein At3g49142 n=1 Tax=Silene latifolia TaxID=37657 RepID=UPI003D77D6E0